MSYSETLRCPLSWWLIGLAFGVSFVAALGMYGGGWVALTATIVTFGIIAAVLLSYGGLRLSVWPDGLHVGRNVLEWEFVGDVSVLDADATRERLHEGSHHDDFLQIRPYVAEAILIEVTDMADPHRSWVLSSRRPGSLVTAIAEHRAG